MIKKVEYLTSVGKFRNYNTSGKVDFRKLTLIYGCNGGGKTTLTSVFRSLVTNNPEIVRSRISTNYTAPQTAQITQTGTPKISHTFGSAGWTTPIADIEIFDIHFVNDNIYSGFDFNDDHKKQLHQFVIGAQGIAIQHQIDQNKAAKVISKQSITEIEQQLIQEVGNNLTTDLINSFVSIPVTQANGIDHQISSAEAAFVSANANIIQTLQPLSFIPQLISGIDYASIIADLQTTSQAIQNAALKTLFSKHCQDLKDNDLEAAENWLQKGFAYVESKQAVKEPTISCPFCKQTINDNVEILNAYIIKFNAEFNALVLRLQSYSTSLQNFNLDAAIQAINNISQTNNGRINSWSTYLPNAILPPTFKIFDDEAVLRVEFQNLISSLL